MTWNKHSFSKLLAVSCWLLAFCSDTARKLSANSSQFSTDAKKLSAISCQLIALFLLSGCSVYSFSGTNIDPTIKTISIATFANNASNGPSFLSQQFTENFKDYFQRNTSLKLVPRDGDLQFEGQILAYDFAPAAIQQANGVDQAGANQLTIQVRVKFTNSKDPKQDFEQTLQTTRSFPATRDIASVNSDQTALNELFRNLITDAFNKSVANW
ncbi:Lipopolysaccharide-assembly [Hymenobacter psychrophilus]|uniref:Lipopolysaccharide-assembly n=1 Tax=Hymenobacter psychrophilus TaxID=651662 RepID=A0A1H3BQF1_9BACT|nr:Lipopolysaccharide-assembly [Hymenobacter psychrophilus]